MEMLLLRTSMVPDWQGGASMPEKATSTFFEWNRLTSPISAMSCGPRIGPTPNNLHDYRVFRQLLARVCICCWSAARVLETVFSWSIACCIMNSVSFRFRHYADMTTGRSIDVQCFIFAEIVTVLLAPLLVFLRECRWSKPTDALTMPEGFYEIQPLFTAISVW